MIIIFSINNNRGCFYCSIASRQSLLFRVKVQCTCKFMLDRFVMQKGAKILFRNIRATKIMCEKFLGGACFIGSNTSC